MATRAVKKHNDGPEVTLQLASATEPFLRVYLDSNGKAEIAGVNKEHIGVAWNGGAAGDYKAIRLRKNCGTTIMIASAAISVGANVYPVASGKVGATRNGPRVGIAVTSSSADGDQIEVLEISEPAAATVCIEHHTASDTLLKEESGSVHTNLGASGAILFTLPQDAAAGVRFHFNAMAAQELRVTPGAAGAIYISGAKQTDNKYISFDDEGEHVTLTADGNGDWIAGPTNGTITVES